MTISKVFIICNAYESGYGHGYEQDKLCNPFDPKTDEYEAYSLGYHEGFGNRQNEPKKCEMCHGKGFTLAPDDHADTCENCNGTGIIK